MLKKYALLNVEVSIKQLNAMTNWDIQDGFYKKCSRKYLATLTNQNVLLEAKLATLTSDYKEHIESLLTENADLKEENEFLKKAAAFFAKSQK